MLPCHRCGKDNTREHNNFFCFSGGALEGDDQNASMLSCKSIAFVDLCFHADHNEESAQGEDSHIEIVKPEESARDCGQFEFHFCSMDCLRAFFKEKLDELESRVYGPRDPETPQPDTF